MTEPHTEERAQRAAEEQEARIRQHASELAQANAAPMQIAQQTASQEQVRQERQRLHNVLDLLPGYVALLNTSHEVLFANRFWRKRFGEPQGRRCFECTPGRTTPCPECRTFRVLSTNAPSRWRWSSPDGRDYEVLDCPFTDGDGSRLVMKVGMDVTKRRRAESIVRRQVGQLATMLATTPDGFWVSDEEMNILDVNDAYCLLSGYSRKELLQMRIKDLEAQETPEEVQRHGQRIREQGFDRFETRHRRKDGGLVDVEISVSYWRQTGQFLQFVRNITEQKRAQADLDRLLDDLQEEVRVRVSTQEQLAASNLELQQRAEQLAHLASELTLTEQRERHRLAQVLHDHLQQLLVGATFGVEVLGRRLTDDAQRTSLDQIRKLLAESIATSRTLTVELSPPILHESGLGAALEWLARWVQEKHALRVDLQVDAEAHTEREDVRVLMFAAVRELLLNVVKHARVMRAAVRLRLDERDNLEIQVKDEGVGFDRKTVWSATSRTSGGFGLFSIRERLHLLGGRMEIKSSPQRGTRVLLVAPRRHESPAAPAVGLYLPEALPSQAAAPTATPPAAQAPPAARTIRVLVADDHAVMRQGLALVMKEERDIEVVGEACDGVEAVELANSLKPDVILMDYSMPRMNGVDATRTISARMPTIRIVGLSMYSEADQAAAMISAGAAAYVTKSGRPEALIAAVRGSA
jgi:PAS domain S-box-containing protein